MGRGTLGPAAGASPEARPTLTQYVHGFVQRISTSKIATMRQTSATPQYLHPRLARLVCLTRPPPPGRRQAGGGRKAGQNGSGPLPRARDHREKEARGQPIRSSRNAVFGNHGGFCLGEDRRSACSSSIFPPDFWVRMAQVQAAGLAKRDRLMCLVFRSARSHSRADDHWTSYPGKGTDSICSVYS